MYYKKVDDSVVVTLRWFFGVLELKTWPTAWISLEKTSATTVQRQARFLNSRVLEAGPLRKKLRGLPKKVFWICFSKV